MITSIELGDFLAHSNTKLEFQNGVTVFVGDNGAGKSSIIDAITFSLFGQHTRHDLDDRLYDTAPDGSNILAGDDELRPHSPFFNPSSTHLQRVDSIAVDLYG